MTRRRLDLFWLALLVLYLIHAVAALRTERVLWGDGAYYMLQILEDREFALGDFSRSGADVLMELPLMASLRLGITDLDGLKLAFGLPPFLFAPLCMALCFWMAGPDKTALCYPLATLAAGSMNTELLVIHESRAALFLFWPILFGLLDPWRRSRTLWVSALLSVPFIAAYESAIALGPLLAFVAWERSRRETSRGLRAASSFCAAAAILATLVALRSVIQPTHPANFALFKQSWSVVSWDGGIGVHLSLAILALAVLGAFGGTRLRDGLTLMAGVACVAGVWVSLSDPAHLAVESQYRARILNVILPALASFALVFGPRLGVKIVLSRDVLGLLFVAQVALQLQMTAQWSAFRQLTREQLGCVHGLIPVDTALAARLPERKLSSQWMRGWHHPALSFLDRAGALNAVLGVSNGYTSWQPFDARHADDLPRLSRYGVDDRGYRATIQRLTANGGSTWEFASCPTNGTGP